MSKVLFIKPQNLLTDLATQVREHTKDWEKGSSVAVKIQPGEYPNLYNVRPQIVECIITELNNNGLEPFIFDTTVKYSGSRGNKKDYLNTFRRHGFTQETMGCPILVSEKTYTVEAPSFKVDIADVLEGIKYLLTISAPKGHLASGYAGAIKNLGMGCVGPDTKIRLHKKTKPKLVGECIKCGNCLKACDVDAIKIDNGWQINYDTCWGCGHCIQDCPEDALAPLEYSLNFQLSEVAQAVTNKRTNLFINIAMDITARCSCAKDPNPPECPNIGAFISHDPVAIDLASIDAIKKEAPNFFGEITKIDPSEQIKHGAKIGLGQDSYELQDVSQ